MSLKRRFPAALVAIALLLRAAVPLGYMPGSVFAGEFMVLCPVGSANSFALLDTIRAGTGAGHAGHGAAHTAGHEHHAHHGHAADGASADGTDAHAHHDQHAGAVDDRCPIDSALSLAFLPAPDVPPDMDRPSTGYPKPANTFPTPARLNRGHPVRGPPAALTFS